MKMKNLVKSITVALVALAAPIAAIAADLSGHIRSIESVNYTSGTRLKVGDKVWMADYLDGTWSLHEVVGHGTRDAVNGRGFLGKPYVAKDGMDNEGGPEMNPNNYPHKFGETCRIAPRD